MEGEYELLPEIVYKFLERCRDSGLRNPAEFLISKMPQVYAPLRGAFPRGILPTDIDGEVELNNYFLRLEFKEESWLRGGGIKKGQLWLFEALVRTGFFTVFLVGFDRKGEPTCMQIFGRNGHSQLECPDGWRTLWHHCRRWSEAVEKRRPTACVKCGRLLP